LHNADMPTTISVPDIPDEPANELAARAALTGRSLQEYLRERLMELVTQPDPEVLVARIRERKTASGTVLTVDEILEYRDADRN
jgi:hypothetical protein